MILAAVGLSISVSLLLLGLGASRTGLATEQSYQAGSLANSCAEESLRLLVESMPEASSTPYTGAGNLTLGQGSCSYTVTNQGGQNSTVVTSGTVGSIIRKVSITVNAIIPHLGISSWQEIP